LLGDRPRAILGEIDVRGAETNRHGENKINECEESQQRMQRLGAIIERERYYTVGSVETTSLGFYGKQSRRLQGRRVSSEKYGGKRSD
jgi:hypothetical protein